jgi:hypothetical protein
MFSPSVQTCSHRLSKPVHTNCSNLFSPTVQACSHQLSKPVLTNCPSLFSTSVQTCSHQLSKPVLTKCSTMFSPTVQVRRLLCYDDCQKSSPNGAPNNSHPCKHLTYSTNQQRGKGRREGERGWELFHTWSNTWMVIKKSLQRHGSLFTSILSESF